MATLKEQVEKLEADLGNQDLYLPKNAEKLAVVLSEHKQKKQDLEAIEDQLLSLE